MASKRKIRKKQAKTAKSLHKSDLKKGDPVIVTAGGNKKKRENKGKVGRIQAFSGKNRDRVIVEGVNVFTRHQKQTSPDKPAGKIEKEAGIHVSNVMYYVEKLEKAVRLKHKKLEDGTRVRGYLNPDTNEFVQI
jgi:large subunit ribosomal protein L24